MANTAVIVPDLPSSGSVTIVGPLVLTGGGITIPAASAYIWSGRSQLVSGADGTVTVKNNAGTDAAIIFGFGGTTSSFPALKRAASSTTLVARLADDSANAPFTAALGTFTNGLTVSTGNMTIPAGNAMIWSGQSQIKSISDGILNLLNNAATGFTQLQLGGTTSSFPSIKVSGTSLKFRLADDSADSAISASTGTFSGAFLYQRQVSAKTTGYSIQVSDSGTFFTNNGAGGSVAFTLPSPAAGLFYDFACTTAQTITIVASSGSIFGPGSLTGATRTILGGTGAIQYSSCRVTAFSGSNWVMNSVSGTVA